MTDFGCFCLWINTSLHYFGQKIAENHCDLYVYIYIYHFQMVPRRNHPILPTRIGERTLLGYNKIEYQTFSPRNSDFHVIDSTSSLDEFQLPQDTLFEFGMRQSLMENMIAFGEKNTEDLNSQSVNFQSVVLTGLTMESLFYPKNTSENKFSLRSYAYHLEKKHCTMDKPKCMDIIRSTTMI